MSRAVTLANFASGQALTLDETNDRVGVGSTSPSKTLDVGDKATVNIGSGGNKIELDGVAGIISTVTLSATTVSVGGTLTYEDVTNVDSTGIVTAGRGVRVTAGGIVVTSGVSTFTHIQASANSTLGNASTDTVTITGWTDHNGSIDVSGISTLTGWVACGDTLALGDNKPIYLGADEDFKIYHDGSEGFITNTTGNLYLSAKDGEGAIRLIPDGAVMVYHDNNKKLETTNSGVTVTGITTTTQLSVGPGVLRENFHNDTGGGITGTYNHDVLTYGMVFYGVTAAVGAWTFNLRGDGSTTFNSLMKVSETAVFTMYVTSTNTSRYMTDFLIDGSSITEKWSGGTAPSAATGSGTDVYTFNILKTGNAAFTVFANLANFA